MPLADYQHKRRTIKYDGGEFDVRGVSLPDLAGLVDRNQAAIDHVAAVVRAQDELNFSDNQAVTEIVLDAIRESPYLVADLISSCAEEPEAYQVAFTLPLTVQVEALQAIADLTFTDAAALKNLVAAVKKLLQGMIPPTTVAAA